MRAPQLPEPFEATSAANTYTSRHMGASAMDDNASNAPLVTDYVDDGPRRPNVHGRFRYKVGPTAYANGDGRSAPESYAILPTTTTAWRPGDNKVRRLARGNHGLRLS